MLRSVVRDRRGVSEVISSLMIILVVSIAGTVLYSFSNDTFSSSWSSFLLETKRREQRTQERFSIMAIWWDKWDQLNLTILNYGKTELAIDAVYFEGTMASIDQGRGVVVMRSRKVQVKFTSPIPIQEEQRYEIIVVSERGSRDVISWKA